MKRQPKQTAKRQLRHPVVKPKKRGRPCFHGTRKLRRSVDLTQATWDYIDTLQGKSISEKIEAVFRSLGTIAVAR